MSKLKANGRSVDGLLTDLFAYYSHLLPQTEAGSVPASSPIQMLHFERTTRFSDQYPIEAVRVHAEVACGKSLKDIAAIIDPSREGVNPCLLLLRPLGFPSVEQIMAEFREWAAEGGTS